MTDEPEPAKDDSPGFSEALARFQALAAGSPRNKALIWMK